MLNERYLIYSNIISSSLTTESTEIRFNTLVGSS